MATSPRSLDGSRSRRSFEWLSVVVAAAVVGASLALAGWVLHDGTQSTATAEAVTTTPLPRLTARQAAAPSVLSSRFVGLPLAGHDRDVLVGVGARPGGPLDVVVVPSDESIVSPSGVTVRLGTTVASGAQATSCGKRCLRFPIRALGGAASTLDVTVDRSGKPQARVGIPLPARLPPTAARLYATARARMFALRSVGMRESLGSGLSPAVLSTWSFQAPDRLGYTIAGGTKAVAIGSERWDWSDGRWTKSSISPIRFPAYSWQDARGARVVGRSRVGGNPVRVLAAMKPGVDFPTWFLLYVTDDGYVVRASMQTTGHFMVDTYDAFDAVPPIRPPS